MLKLTAARTGSGGFAPLWEMAGAIYGDAVPYVQKLLVSPTHGSPTGPLDKHGKPTGPPTAYRPEGHGGPVIHGGAHVGDGPPRFGTLMHYGMAKVV